MEKKTTPNPEHNQNDKEAKGSDSINHIDQNQQDNSATNEISEEELEALREEARQKYNRLLGCGG